MSLELYSHRYKQGPQWTLSVLKIAGHEFTCYVLEDEKRKVKVRGETAIPVGRYQIKFRKELSDKTSHYRTRFPVWFKWHLWLQDVPGFQYIYIHVGNTPKDSDGCILVGNTRNEILGHIGNSVAAFTVFYQIVAHALNKGEEVWITITEDATLKPQD